MESLTVLRAALAADLEQMEPGASWWSGLARTILFPRWRAVLAYRLGAVLVARDRRLLPVAYLLEARALRASAAEISPLAVIGPGLCLVHSAGVVIGPGVIIGARARIHQGVTIGDGPTPGRPVLGDDVMVGAGASILGGVVIGSGARIGAGAVVVRDVPPFTTAAGVPATVKGHASDRA